MIHVDVAIIGGGMAGLAAANRLVDQNVQVMLIEEKTYPSHRVCGEFYSPECVAMLMQWGVSFPIAITEARFFAGNYSCQFTLKAPARGISRYTIDEHLAKRVRDRGGIVLDGVRVVTHKSLENEQYHVLELSSQETVCAKQVIISTGRHSPFAQKHWEPFTPGPTPYIGIKMHFSGIAPCDYVEMHAARGAYVGISSIEDGKTNVACLAKTNIVQKQGGPEQFMDRLIADTSSLHKTLGGATKLFPRYLTCGVPRFGKRNTPHASGVYYIGDVAGAITPLCGDGLGMAVTGGIMAADYALKNDWHGYAIAWSRRYRGRLLVGQVLQSTFFFLPGAKLALAVCNALPFISRSLFSITREW